MVATLASRFVQCFEEQNQILKNCFEEQNSILLENLPKIIAEAFTAMMNGSAPPQQLSQEAEEEEKEEASGTIEDIFNEEFLDEDIDFGDIP